MPEQHHEHRHSPNPYHPLSDLLPGYAAALALGYPPAELYDDLVAHLRTCAACQADLDDLLEIVEPVYAGAFERARTRSKPDLSFLEEPVIANQTARPWRLDAGRLLITFSESFLAALRQPALAGLARGRLLYRYTQEPGSIADLDVEVEVYAEDLAQRNGRVRVCVDVPSRGPLDQTGSVVVLQAGQVRLEGATDESGTVDFAPVPLEELPYLRVKIVPLRENMV
jgi:hypothetical protein